MSATDPNEPGETPEKDAVSRSLPSPAAADDAEKGPIERLGPVVAAVGTGLGVLGFVTFAGGAITYGRFVGAKLPAEEALSVIPTQQLVVTGAWILGLAALAGLIAVGLFYVALVVLHTDEGREALRANRGSRTRYLGGATLWFLACTWGLFWVVGPGAFGSREILAGAFVGTLMIVLAGCVGRATRKVPYWAFAAFLSTAVFASAIGYGQAVDAGKVRGAALLRQNQKAIAGVFVAEDDKRVYIARLELVDEKPPGKVAEERTRVMAIDRGEISDYGVGSPKVPALALEQGVGLARELCSLQVPPKAQQAGKPKKKASTESQEAGEDAGECFRGQQAGELAAE